MAGRGDEGAREYARIEGLASPGAGGSARPGAAHAYFEDLISEETRLRETAADERHRDHRRRLEAVEAELDRLAHLLRRRSTSRHGEPPASS
jgi:hypothetical protein